MDVLKGENKFPHINTKYIKELEKLETDSETWFTTGIAAKFFYMRTWLQNLNFHAGNQWLTYNEHNQTFEIQPQLDDEIKLTINKILPSVRLAVGKLLMDRKRPIVLQRNQDEEAIETSKVATKLLEHDYRVNDGLYTEKEVLTWSALCGKGYTKKWYDKEKDAIVTDIISPFEIIVPPNVNKMSKMPWICHARFETREWVYDNYGIEVEGQSDWGQYGMFLAAVKNVMQDGNYTGVYTQSLNDNVMVKDYWLRPCKEYPQGALIIEVDNKIIYADKNPYNDDDDEDFYWPFAELDFFDSPYRYWPISLVENLVDMNKWINETYSQNLENIQYSNSPTWWALEGTVYPDEVSKKPGSINFYTGQQHPIAEAQRSIDPSVFEQVSKFEQAMGELAGIHFFGPGSLPPGVHAAAALAIINQQDQMAVMPVSTNHEKWVRENAKQTLHLIRKWAPDKMYIRVMGEEGQWEVIEFKKDMLYGDEEIHIESKQELASDKMTKFEQVLKLMTTLGDDGKPIIDTEKGLRLLDLEKDMGMVTPRALNRNMQMDENQKLWKGETVDVYEWEDHKAHIEGCLEEMLTIKFKQASDKIQHAFINHYRAHMAMMNNAQQQGQASQQVTQDQAPMMPQGQPPMMGQPMGPPGMPPQGIPMPSGPNMVHPGMMPPPGMAPGMPMNGGLNAPIQQGPPTQTAAGLQQGMANALNPLRG